MLDLARENHEVVRGDTWMFYIDLVDSDTQLCFDASDWVGKLTIKEKVKDTNNEAKIVVHKFSDHPDADEENGHVYFKASAQQMGTLEEKKYFYDITFEKVIDGEEYSYTPMYGDLIVHQQVNQ